MAYAHDLIALARGCAIQSRLDLQRAKTLNIGEAMVKTDSNGQRNGWIILSIVSLAILMSTIDGRITALALPILQEEFSVSFAAIQWVTLAYMLSMTALVLTVSRIADVIGVRRIFIGSLSLFTIASACAAVPVSFFWLIAWRAAQGAGASAIVALSPAILTSAFPQSARGKAMGIVGTIVSVGTVAGPVLGGALLSIASWSWIFLVNLPIGIIALILSSRYLPDSTRAPEQAFDFLGAITIGVATTMLLVGLTLGQVLGFTSSISLLLLIFGFSAFIYFFYNQSVISNGLINISIFKNTQFSVNLALSSISLFVLSGFILVFPFFIQEGLLMVPGQAGILLGVLSVSIGVVSPIAGILSDRLGAQPVVGLALIVILGAFIWLIEIGAKADQAVLSLAMALVGLGYGLFQAPNNSAMMGAVTSEQRAGASGTMALARMLSQTGGAAFFATLWSLALSVSSETRSSGIAGGEAGEAIAFRGAVFVMVLLLLISLLVLCWRAAQRILAFKRPT